MSTIRVDNFGPSAGGTTYSADGIAKAWVKITNGSSTPTAADSLNVSSIVDAAVGRYQVNWSTNFNTVNYAMTAGTLGQNYSYSFGTGYGYNTTSAVYSNWVNRDGANYDMPEASIMAVGDLA